MSVSMHLAAGLTDLNEQCHRHCTMTPNPCPQDVWVCNAGQSQQVKRPLAETAPAELQSIVDTNLTGEDARAWGRWGGQGARNFQHALMPRPCTTCTHATG